MTDMHDVSVCWAAERLHLLLPQENPSGLVGRAEVLVTIAERYEFPIELLIEWIDTRAPGKQWAAAEWRRWCERHREAQIVARHRHRQREREREQF